MVHRMEQRSPWSGDARRPIYLDSELWKTLPEPYYGDTNVNYNDADSGDINGDGYDDIVIGSTRSTPTTRADTFKY